MKSLKPGFYSRTVTCLVVIVLGSKNEIGLVFGPDAFGVSLDIEFRIEGVHGRVIGEHRVEKSGTFFVIQQRTNANTNADVATLNLRKIILSNLYHIWIRELINQ